ncbi:MAG: MFS transporter [Desulfobaccales bacterium]
MPRNIGTHGRETNEPRFINFMFSHAEAQKAPSSQSLRALDYLNFFLADVRGGVGPYMAIYLLSTLHWDPKQIGVVLSIMGIATLIAQTPCGALVDAVKPKRLLVVGAASLVGLSCIGITIFSNYYFILTSQLLNGVVDAIFPPAIAAITLGMVAHQNFAPRIGRNEVFNHAGNVGAALLAGITGYFLGQTWIFYSITMLALASMASVLFIRRNDIDYLQARAASPDMITDGVSAVEVRTLFTDRNILVFAVAVTLFHFGNAAMLPLAGELVSKSHEAFAAIAMSACIIAAQLVMVPVAALSGKFGDRWGRKPVFLIGFAVLPLRGLLFTVSSHPFYVVAVQLLDGIGAGIFGVLYVIVVADLTQGTGRYNLALGVIATAQGIGAALSNLVSGYIVNAWGFNAGFLFLAVIAALAFLVYYVLVPETKGIKQIRQVKEAL